jgi:large subunit ribosomal protein L22
MTMKYSFNRSREGVIFSNMKDINASFKDLGAVCASIRYKSVPMALADLDGVVNEGKAVLYRKHNKYMGHRHELGGKKGRFPIKCAMIVRKALVNAAANARNKGFMPEMMFVVHSSANKTMIRRTGPSKGALFTLSSYYGYQPARSSDLEFARVELGIATPDAKGLSDNMKHQIKRFAAIEKKYGKKQKLPEQLKKKGIKLLQKKEDKKEAKEQPTKPEAAKKPEAKPAETQKKEPGVQKQQAPEAKKA